MDDYRTFRACLRCEDTGFALSRCDGGSGLRGLRDTHLPLARCAHCGPHKPHSYAERCSCAGTNPVLLARRERDARRQLQTGLTGSGKMSL